jgi:phage terminase large subunit GpA-like protein
LEAAHLTAAIDVHDDVLYWLATAWLPDCTGYVVDYGTWPDQRLVHFAKRQATKTLARRHPGIGREGALIAGLGELVDQLCGREWLRENGTPARISKLLIDASYAPDQVEHVARTSTHAAVLQISKGVGIGAAKCPISEYPRKPGRTLGYHWYIESRGGRLRLLHPDTNHWKTWLHSRLTAPPTVPGSLTLFGRGDVDHRLLGEHLVAEVPTEVTSVTHRRTVIEWQPPRGKDNHWLDCLVYCAVAASLLGCRLGATAAAPVKTSLRSRALAAAKLRGRVP